MAAARCPDCKAESAPDRAGAHVLRHASTCRTGHLERAEPTNALYAVELATPELVDYMHARDIHHAWELARRRYGAVRVLTVRPAPFVDD